MTLDRQVTLLNTQPKSTNQKVLITEGVSPKCMIIQYSQEYLYKHITQLHM